MKSKYITPSVTLFNEDGHIDIEAMKKHYDFLIDGGVDGILVLGSIGEFFSIPLEEKKKLIDCSVAYINKRVKVIIGTTSMDINEIIELSKYANDKGADGCIILPPFYFPLSEESIEKYFDYIAEQLPNIPLYIYNFPDRTGYGIPVKVTHNLLKKHKNIVGYKDTQSGMAHTVELIKTVKKEFPEFEVYAGFDDNFAHNVLSGGNGCIGGLSNVVPQICSGWVKAFDNENLKETQYFQQKINGLMEIYQVGTPFVPYIKAAISEVGCDVKGNATFPFIKATETDKKKIKEILEKYEIL